MVSSHTNAIIINIWQLLANWKDPGTKKPHGLSPFRGTYLVSQYATVLLNDVVHATIRVAQLEDGEAEKGGEGCTALWRGVQEGEAIDQPHSIGFSCYLVDS